MKNLLFALLFTIPLFFVGCSSEDDDSDSLDGTVWVADSSIDEISAVITLTFRKSSFEMSGETINYTPKMTIEVAGTYTYSGNKVILIADGIDPSENEMTFTINGNKMTSSPDENGDSVIFTKK